MPAPQNLILHASAVALGDRGLLIQGPSGSGKSALALRLMALGASLVADDRTVVTDTPSGLVMTRPDTLPAAIEARFVGLLAADLRDHAPLSAVVDLGQTEDRRLPDPHHTILMSRKVPLFRAAATPYFPEALVQFLKAGLWSEM